MAKGRVVHSPFYMLRCLVIPGKSTKISAVVPEKVGKTSVIRHRMRRKIYESLRPIMSSIPAGLYAIVFAKAVAMKPEDPEIDAHIRELFVKAGVLK